MKFLRSIIGLPRRRLLGMKQEDLQTFVSTASETLTEFANRKNGFGPEPEAQLYEKPAIAKLFPLMLRAIRRKGLESQAESDYPASPKRANRRHGQNMSRARGADN